MGLAVVVLKTGFKAAQAGAGQFGEDRRAVVFHRDHHGAQTRSGTLVGPGTNRKLRPAMRTPSCAWIASECGYMTAIGDDRRGARF